jgi:hypothetical protein
MEDQELQETLAQAEPESQETEQHEQEPAQEQVQQTKPTNNDHNIRNLRQKAEERDYYFQKYQELESQRNYKQPAPEPEEDEPKPDDLVEWRQVQKRFKKLENEIHAYKQQATADTAESRIRAKHPDFESVVNGETIAALREQYPELAATVNSSNDLYTKAAAAYTLIKKLGIVQETQYAPDRDRVQANTGKPRPLTSVSPNQGSSPLSKANAFASGLNDDMKKQLYKEMQEAKKRA